MDTDGDRWLRAHPKVELTLPDPPSGDWRSETGYGWIAKVWFPTRKEAHAARAALREEGWEWDRWSVGRKVRVDIRDGFDGQRFVELVLARWPDVRRIQLRCD